MQALDLASQRFGRLLVLARAGSDAKGRSVWNCLCDCSRTVLVSGKSLTSGNTSSCGCLWREQAFSAASRKNRKHGLTYSPIWQVWSSMRRRCREPTHVSFKDYGGRGIKVCQRWESFDAFYADMAPRPAGLTIDRIDNDSDYEPGNCRWATHVEQARNRRSNRKLTAFGETKTQVEWVEDPRCSVSHDTFWKRLVAGWPIERAILEHRHNTHAYASST